MAMKRVLAVCISAILFLGNAPASAQVPKTIKLPAPRTEGGKPLMQALKERKSQREFSSRELSLQVISDLLWAANGINRQDSGLRTAPSAMNMREIDIYVAKQDGLYLFDTKEHKLVLVLPEDIRSLTGHQAFVKDAPVGLIYVANLSKMNKFLGKWLYFYAAADTAFIGENVYLYCASAGLATVILSYVDKDSLAKAMRLEEDKMVVFTQPVGYPKG